MNRLSIFLASLAADPTADKIVPPTGVTARLTLFAAGAMAFMAVFAIAISLAAGHLAERWGDALKGVATIEIASGDTAEVERALSVLETTPGVLRPREVSEERQQALLAPWLGTDFPLEALALPRLIELREGPSFDPDGLMLRLSAEAPSARYLKPDEWQSRVASAAQRVSQLSVGLILLTGAVVAAMISLAATTALVAQAGVIETLRLIGAEDSFIARAFVRRFTLRTLGGAALGTLLAALVLLSLSRGDESLLSLLRPDWRGWLAILALPFLSGTIAFVSTRLAATRVLARLL